MNELPSAAPTEMPKRIHWRDCSYGIMCTCGDDDYVVTDEGETVCETCGRVWTLDVRLVGKLPEVPA